MAKLKVILVGSSGKMGQEIAALIAKDRDLALVANVDEKNPISKIKAKADVVIDFSGPESSLEVAEWCSKNQTPWVCGTTGFTEAQFKKLKAASHKTAVLYASNMSLGVATLRRAMEALKALADYDFQIVETHHNQKKDSPSGTAKTLHESLQKVVGRKLPEPLALRGGGVFGIHEVHVMGSEETLKFTHTALNRSVFARGALSAAKFLIEQKPGLYSIDDVLDHRK